MIFAILKQKAENNTAIHGQGVLEILQDGFGFQGSRSKLSTDDIYVSPSPNKVQ